MVRSIALKGISKERLPLWQVVRRRLRRWGLQLAGKQLIWTTQNNTDIAVVRGKKSPNDFVVKYKEPGRPWRTPRHLHLIVELYVKSAYNEKLTMELRDHLLEVFRRVQPAHKYPPALQVYQQGDEQKFAALDAVGEYTVEFMLVVSELIFIQEKTNYPTGSLTYELYEEFGVKERFSVLHKAAFRGRR